MKQEFCAIFSSLLSPVGIFRNKFFNTEKRKRDINGRTCFSWFEFSSRRAEINAKNEFSHWYRNETTRHYDLSSQPGFSIFDIYEGTKGIQIAIDIKVVPIDVPQNPRSKYDFSPTTWKLQPGQDSFTLRTSRGIIVKYEIHIRTGAKSTSFNREKFLPLVPSTANKERVPWILFFRQRQRFSWKISSIVSLLS